MNKDEYVRKMHAKLDHWNAEIDTLSARMEQVGADTRAEYHKQVEAMRGKREEARKKLDVLQHSSEGAWEDMKAGVEMAWDAIGEAMNSIKSRFK
jgi:predicted  nucleic acid-binding Zn-ribbon protein